MWLPLKRPLLGTWPATQACALTGNRTSELSLCRMTPNQLSYFSWILERERDINLLFHLLVHALVDSCMCPDPRLDQQPRRIGTMLQLSRRAANTSDTDTGPYTHTARCNRQHPELRTSVNRRRQPAGNKTPAHLET